MILGLLLYRSLEQVGGLIKHFLLESKDASLHQQGGVVRLDIQRIGDVPSQGSPQLMLILNLVHILRDRNLLVIRRVQPHPLDQVPEPLHVREDVRAARP